MFNLEYLVCVILELCVGDHMGDENLEVFLQFPLFHELSNELFELQRDEQSLILAEEL